MTADNPAYAGDDMSFQCEALQHDPEGIGKPHRCGLPAGHEGLHRAGIARWPDPYPEDRTLRGAVVTWSHLEDGTRTIEIALDDDTLPFPLGDTVEVRRV